MFYMLGVFAVMAYGWRKLFVGNREKLELAREKMWSRIHIMPLLQAEEDRDQVRRMYADKAREKELLGSESSVMNNDRYVLPFVVRLSGHRRDTHMEEPASVTHADPKFLQIRETNV